MTSKNKTAENKRLGKNFHRTFAPERQYLGALLKYAADGGLYEKQAIADKTGIPTGISSGKSLPTADYCRAMNLVTTVKEKDGEHLRLTSWGRTVLLEDKFFKEDLTQWLSHLYLCQKRQGAEVWYQIFWNGAEILGQEFTVDTLTNWIYPILKVTDMKVMSPTFRMYGDDQSFKQCGAIREQCGVYYRTKAPIISTYAIAYAVWMTGAIECNGCAGAQVSLDELEGLCGFRHITGWTLAESRQCLALLEQKGVFSIDRHMEPWLICNKYASSDLWKRVYEDFL